MTYNQNQHKSNLHSTQNGTSLVELLLGLMSAILLTLILSNLYLSVGRSATNNHAEQELQSTALYTSNLLSDHIRHAAYWGDATRSAVRVGSALTNTRYPCDGTQWTRLVNQPLTGTNQNEATYPCLLRKSNRWIKGDTITVRYSNSQHIRKYASDTLYLRSSPTKIAIFLGKDRKLPENQFNSPFVDRKIMSNTFYITQSKHWCNQNSTPALALLSRSSNGKLRRKLIVAGIAQLQVEYSTDFTNYTVANKIAKWKDIKSVKLWIVVRTLCPYYRHARTTQLQFSDIRNNYSDRYKRKLYSFIVTLRNRI